ncbi:MAG TPA: heparan-alpha-glucosaminide N-acetyltransferase, partial [Afifellaceae bacterium]|nr:heparan-alpha-glucosaminide N-acetyltransferase [Afifellaceae bacterium]
MSVDVDAATGHVLSNEPLRPRLRTVDVVRGLAIAGVVLFHLVWDLDFAGLVTGNPSRNPAWLMFGHVLAATFIALVGVSLALAHRGGVRWRPFFSRLLVIAAAAIAITIGTLLVFPDAFVFFGILHLIAVASLIGVLFVPLPAVASLVAGGAILIAASLFSDPLFDTRWLAW